MINQASRVVVLYRNTFDMCCRLSLKLAFTELYRNYGRLTVGPLGNAALCPCLRCSHCVHSLVWLALAGQLTSPRPACTALAPEQLALPPDYHLLNEVIRVQMLWYCPRIVPLLFVLLFTVL